MTPDSTPPDDGRDPLAGLDPLRHHDELPHTRREALEMQIMERQLAAMLAHARLVSEQIAELTRRLVTVESRQHEHDNAVKRLTAEMAENTEITKQVRDLLTAMKVAKQVGNGIGWFAKTAAAVGLLWAAVLAVLHVKPPTS
jgi:hypothetical protein